MSRAILLVSVRDPQKKNKLKSKGRDLSIGINSMYKIPRKTMNPLTRVNLAFVISLFVLS